MIRAVLGRLAGWLVAAIFALAAIALIVFDIFGTNWPELEEPAGELVAGEVRKYVLFTSVPFKHWEVTTGVRYVSTAKREVESQWCYIAKPGGFGGPTVQLTLATSSGAGKPRPRFYPDAGLRPFNLTKMTAQALVKSHCRFQKAYN